jgi:hypothetical protein
LGFERVLHSDPGGELGGELDQFFVGLNRGEFQAFQGDPANSPR